MIIPIAQIATNSASSRGLTALRSITRDGRDNVVTAIINASTVPSSAPFASRGLCHRDRSKNIRIHGNSYYRCQHHAKGIVTPSTVSTQLSGIQLWMIAPSPTPTRI